MKLSIHGNASPSSSSSSSSSSMPVVGDASHPDSTGTRPAERARPQTSGRGDRQPSTVHHRWTRSHEEDRRPSRDGARPAPPRTLRPSRGSIGVDGALDGGRRHLPRTHRRNSDSSVVESKANPSEPRQRRHLDRPPVEVSAHGPAPSRSQPKRANRRLDVIDKLDVTSIYGTGRTSSSSSFPPPFFFNSPPSRRLVRRQRRLLTGSGGGAVDDSLPPRRSVRCLQPPSESQG